MILFSIAALIGVCVLAVMAWGRSRRAGKTAWRVALVEGLRVTLVAAAVWLLWQPETVYQVPSDRKGNVVVLIDRSDSMKTIDAVSDSQRLARSEVADQIMEDAYWLQLEDRFERSDLEFANEAGDASDLAAALDQANQRFESAAAFVLLSDGDWNSGRPPESAATDIAIQSGGSAVVFTVPLGGREKLPDIEVAAEIASFGVTGKPVRIPFSIRNWFAKNRDVTVSLEVNGETIQQESRPIASGGQSDDVFTWQPEQPGEYSVRVAADLLPGETNEANNQLMKRVEIRNEKLRVLIVESTPRWEFRYLRNALLRDPGIDVSCLLFHPSIDSVGGGAKDYLETFPANDAELASYDVIFLGDVGVTSDQSRSGQLTIEQCGQIRGLVEQQAVGLVLMPGSRGRQSALIESELGELYPVVIDRSKPLGVGSEDPGGLSLTNAGRTSLLMALDDDSEINWAVWESLPGFYWHASVARAKAGSEVLAVHEEASNQHGRLPLIVTRPSGAGKVLFMGTDAAWRWRMGVEDKYHYRFWGQVIRWMAYQRNMAVGQTMRLSYRPDQPQTGESITFRASVMTSGGSPSQADQVLLDVVAPNGTVTKVQLQRAEGEWGVFNGQTPVDQIGSHTLVLNHPSENGELKARVDVQGRAVEQIGRPARPDIMKEIARVGGGESIPPAQVDRIVKRINSLPPDPSEMRRIQWWNHPAVLLAMIGGLGLFWVGRKWVGAV